MSLNNWRGAMRWGALALAFSLLGCGDDPGTGTAGELGQGTFDYRCESNGDLKCSGTNALDDFEIGSDFGSRTSSIPAAVAVGAVFGIRYAGTEREDGDAQNVSLSAVAPGDEISSGVYRLDQPTEAAFVAENDGEVVDFIYMSAVEATELEIWSEQEEIDSLRLDEGDKVELTVAPRSDAGTFLAGALSYQWASTDADVAGIGRLGSDGDDDSVRNEGDIVVEALQAGTATIRVRAGDLEATVEVEVRP